MQLRSLAATAALFLLASPSAAQLNALRDHFAAQLQAATDDTTGTVPFTRVWDAADSLVLHELRQGRTTDAVNLVLAKLPGFSGTSRGNGVRIGGGTYYSELPRELPGYVLLPLRAGRETLLMGVYNFGINGPGRVSLFAQREGGWRRTGGMDARWPVVPYLLPLADSGLAMATLETFTGGDHQDGAVRIWRVEGGSLMLLDSVAGEMREPRARSTFGAVQLFFTRFPAHLSTAVLGTRIEHYVTLTAAGRAVRQAKVIGNPWVEIVDRYYALSARNPAAAQALLADPTLAGLLGTNEPTTFDDAGDLRAGWLVIEIGRRRYRVSSQRGPDGAWRITSVIPKLARE